MNKERRKRIQAICTRLVLLKDELEEIEVEEQEYFDNLSEGLQQGEKGEKSEQCISDIQDAIYSIESAQDSLATAIE